MFGYFLAIHVDFFFTFTYRAFVIPVFGAQDHFFTVNLSCTHCTTNTPILDFDLVFRSIFGSFFRTIERPWMRCMQWVDFSARFPNQRFRLFGFTFCTSISLRFPDPVQLARNFREPKCNGFMSTSNNRTDAYKMPSLLFLAKCYVTCLQQNPESS
jgi:hypothetical protein